MASIETNTVSSFSLGALLSRLGNSFVNAFDALTVANSRVQQVEALNALSDAELAAKNLKREDIARYVFRDMFYV